MTPPPALLLAHKEWKESVNSPTPYIAFVLFFLLLGYFWISALFLSGQASLEEFFAPMPFVLGIFLPAFTMRLFSEEYKTGTMENLATLPLKDADIVLGKYAAALALWAAVLGFSLVYPVILIVVGPPDPGPLIAGYAGVFLLGAFYGALGLLASSVTRSQVVALLLGFLFCFGFFLVGKTAQYVPGLMGGLLTYLGVDSHMESFLKGVVDSRDVLYFLSGTALALGGTLASVNSRRWR